MVPFLAHFPHQLGTVICVLPITPEIKAELQNKYKREWRTWPAIQSRLWIDSASVRLIKQYATHSNQHAQCRRHTATCAATRRLRRAGAPAGSCWRAGATIVPTGATRASARPRAGPWPRRAAPAARRRSWCPAPSPSGTFLEYFLLVIPISSPLLLKWSQVLKYDRVRDLTF